LILRIYDRYGVKIFEGNKDIDYKRDRKINKIKKFLREIAGSASAGMKIETKLQSNSQAGF